MIHVRRPPPHHESARYSGAYRQDHRNRDPAPGLFKKVYKSLQKKKGDTKDSREESQKDSPEASDGHPRPGVNVPEYHGSNF
jgi:hypothetical protein